MSLLPERIEVVVTAPPVSIPGRVLNELCTHALETRPEECCGLLTGVGGNPFRSVHRCRNTMTQQHQGDPDAYPRDGTQAYYMSEVDYLLGEELEHRLAVDDLGVRHLWPRLKEVEGDLL